jgi:hypothetical protein
MLSVGHSASFLAWGHQSDGRRLWLAAAARLQSFGAGDRRRRGGGGPAATNTRATQVRMQEKINGSGRCSGAGTYCASCWPHRCWSSTARSWYTCSSGTRPAPTSTRWVHPGHRRRAHHGRLHYGHRPAHLGRSYRLGRSSFVAQGTSRDQPGQQIEPAPREVTLAEFDRRLARIEALLIAAAPSSRRTAEAPDREPGSSRSTWPVSAACVPAGQDRPDDPQDREDEADQAQHPMALAEAENGEDQQQDKIDDAEREAQDHGVPLRRS